MTDRAQDPSHFRSGSLARAGVSYKWSASIFSTGSEPVWQQHGSGSGRGRGQEQR